MNVMKSQNNRVVAQAYDRLAAFVDSERQSSVHGSDGIQWQWSNFAGLTGEQVYEMIKLRERVFCVEQNCVYLDCDGKDFGSWHLLGWIKSTAGEQSGDLVLGAYLRVLPPGLRFQEISIGRVVVAPEFRRQGFGKLLMSEGISRVQETFGAAPIRIAAQAYLERFYTELGFKKESEEFLEDDIPHIEMVKF